mgnify:CR=1 FL=1
MLLRLFIALDLSEETKHRLFAHMLALKRLRLNGSWVREENLHLTLKFLGPTDDFAIPRIEQILTMIGNDTNLIQASIARIGAFPSLRNPRVVFFNVEDNGKIMEVFKKVDSYSAHWGGTQEERPFTPHITFIRLKQHSDLSVPSTQPLLSFKPIKETFKELSLFKSTLTSSGAVYEPIHTFPFHL